MIIRDLQDGDLEFVRENPLEGAVKNYPRMFPTPPAYTIIFDDEIVGVGGMIILWKGVAEMWLMLTANCRKEGFFGIIAFEAIKNKVDEMLEEHKIRRAQCTVRVDFPKARKMVVALGFTLEGLMKCYCPDGCDVWLYARITKWE